MTDQRAAKNSGPLTPQWAVRTGTRTPTLIAKALQALGVDKTLDELPGMR
jgi:hypothetical protein